MLVLAKQVKWHFIADVHLPQQSLKCNNSTVTCLWTWHELLVTAVVFRGLKWHNEGVMTWTNSPISTLTNSPCLYDGFSWQLIRPALHKCAAEQLIFVSLCARKKCHFRTTLQVFLNAFYSGGRGRETQSLFLYENTKYYAVTENIDIAVSRIQIICVVLDNTAVKSSFWCYL